MSGKNGHCSCLKCKHCSKALSPGSHSMYDGVPYCDKPCYENQFGLKASFANTSSKSSSSNWPPMPWARPDMDHSRLRAVNVKGEWYMMLCDDSSPRSHSCAGDEMNHNQNQTGVVNVEGVWYNVYDSPPAELDKQSLEEPSNHKQLKVDSSLAHSMCPSCDKVVYFAEKVVFNGCYWHKACLRCERCRKILPPGGSAEHLGLPYCHKPCYGILFGPKGVNRGLIGYIPKEI
ncbi:cysteine-rich protein 2-like isoform X2 [Engraulis encrasicolus]